LLQESNRYKVFNGANNFNPQYSADGTQVYFLSNRDGFRNLYRYTLATVKLEQMTDLFTGICGITEYSPALSYQIITMWFTPTTARKNIPIYNAKVSDFKPLLLMRAAPILMQPCCHRPVLWVST
jgi:Tol biopolymer transport system component